MNLKASDFDLAQYPQTGKYRLNLAVDESASLPLLLARGMSDGPVLLVSACVHGDEYEGVRAIFEVFEQIEAAQLRGNLLMAPVVNVPAFWSGTRNSPVDGANLARVFPGQEDGALSERIAFAFARFLIARASFYLDLHSGGIRFRMPSMVGYRSTDVQACAAAEIFGARVIWGHPRIDPGRTVSVADQLGIPWLYTEARGAGRIHPDDLSMMKNGIVNLMHHLKMLPGECKRVEITHRLSGDGNTDAGVSATNAGFLMTQVGILDEVNAGQLLGTLVDILGEPIEEYRAPAAGIIGLVREFPVVQAGDSLFLIAERER